MSLAFPPVLLVLFLLAHSPLFSQQDDIRISPPDTATYPVPKSIMIQSADGIGDATLVVWGGTAPNGGNSVRPVLWGGIVRGTGVRETPFLVTGADAQPAGVVSVLGLDNLFLALWNDLRSPDSGIYMQRLDMSGKLIGSGKRLAGPAMLQSDAEVWLLRDSIGYSIIWSEAVAGDQPRYLRQRLEPSGLPLGTRQTLPSTNFDDELRYGDLPGAIIVQGNPVRLRHPGGQLDERLIAGERFALPHYLAADSSLALLRYLPGDSVVLEYYRNLFDADPARRIPVPSFERRISDAGAVGLDSAGNYRVVFLAEKRDNLQKLLCIYSTTLNGAGEFSVPAQMAVIGQGADYSGGSYTFTVAFAALQYRGGDDNAHRIIFRSTFTQTGRAGNPTSSSFSRDDTVLLDGYGNISRLDAVKRSMMLDDLRSRPELQRVIGYDSSIVQLVPDTIGVPLAVPLASLAGNLAQTTPALALAGGEIIAIWNQPEQRPRFHQAKLFSRPGADVIPLPPFIPDATLPYSRDREQYSSAGSVVPVAGGGVVRFEAMHSFKYDPAGWLPTFDFRMYPPTDSGWNRDAIGYDYKSTNSPISDARYAYDPNTRLTLACFTSSDYGKGGHRIVVSSDEGRVLWDTLHIYPSVGNLIVRGPRNYINIHDDVAFGMNGISLFSLNRSAATAGARYGRSLGEYFFRCYPVVPVDPGGRMKSPEVQFERYDFSGMPAGSVRIKAPGGYFDPVIVPRSADSSLYVLWPSDSGVWLTVIASNLGLASDPERISATSGRVKGVAGVFRNDSLFLAWEDYRNGAPDIYGKVQLPSVLPAGPTTVLGDPGVPGAIRLVLYPTPAHRQVNMVFDMPQAGGVNLMIMNTAGQTVASDTFSHVGAGTRIFTLNVEGFAPGAYFVTLLLDNGTISQGRFIVQ